MADDDDAPDWDRDGRDWPNRAASRFVTANGLRWHVQRLGAGPKLLLVHGTAASTHSFAGLLPLVARDFDVLAPDLPGHGFTQKGPSRALSLPGMAANLDALCREFDFAPDIVVGHSAGAAILVAMCLDGAIAPRVVIGLNAALLPFPGIGRHLFPAMARTLFLNDLTPKLFSWQARDPRAVERVITGTGSRIGPKALDYYVRLFRKPRHISSALAMMAQWDLETLQRNLPRLDVPLVLVAAENDKAVTPEQAFKVRDLVPGSRVVYIRHHGHLAHEEDPSGLRDLIAGIAREAGIRVEADPQSMTSD